MLVDDIIIFPSIGDCNAMISVPGHDSILKLITAFHPEARVYLFGSYAKGTVRATSDIDIAIDIGWPLGWREISFLKNLFEALPIVEMVDLVDLQTAPEGLKRSILTEGILWKP
jgi:uncharacterized protein